MWNATGNSTVELKCLKVFTDTVALWILIPRILLLLFLSNCCIIPLEVNWYAKYNKNAGIELLNPNMNIFTILYLCVQKSNVSCYWYDVDNTNPKVI